MTFEELNLAPAIVQAVHEQGYTTPTPIQEQAIPAVWPVTTCSLVPKPAPGKRQRFRCPSCTA